MPATPASAALRAPPRCSRARTPGRGAGAAPSRPSAASIRVPRPPPRPACLAWRPGMANLVEPHGGALIERGVPAAEADALRARAATLPRIPLDGRELSDLELFATGA